jgi:hypothetical protein
MERRLHGRRADDYVLRHYRQHETRCPTPQVDPTRGMSCAPKPTTTPLKPFGQLLLAITHGTFCFMSFEGYGWYLSSTAALLYCSYFLHNIVAWVKIRPFFIEPRSLFQPKTAKIVRRVYLITLALTIPPMVLQITNNFLFFNNKDELYKRVRLAEPFFRLADTCPCPCRLNKGELVVSVATLTQRTEIHGGFSPVSLSSTSYANAMAPLFLL